MNTKAMIQAEEKTFSLCRRQPQNHDYQLAVMETLCSDDVIANGTGVLLL